MWRLFYRKRGGMGKLAITVIALLLLAFTVSLVGCTEPEEAPLTTPVPTSAPTPTLVPTPTPAPTPVIVSKTWNVTRMLSGLSITLTVVSWTGDEAVVEWEIENQTGQTFAASRLYSIFTPGAYATDQEGIEGEYFIPAAIKQDLKSGDSRHYETKWLFYPESSVITIRLSDVYPVDHNFVDASAQFVFSR
jgi:hypothetical protein